MYLEGYVRRRISGLELEKIPGMQFFELSESGGPGCSGAPVIKRPPTGPWQLIGICVGDRQEGAYAYAAREDGFREWLLTFFPVGLGTG